MSHTFKSVRYDVLFTLNKADVLFEVHPNVTMLPRNRGYLLCCGARQNGSPSQSYLSLGYQKF